MTRAPRSHDFEQESLPCGVLIFMACQNFTDHSPPFFDSPNGDDATGLDPFGRVTPCGAPQTAATHVG